MAQKVKCPYCGERFDKEIGVKKSNRYYHPECFEKERREKLDKKKQQAKKKEDQSCEDPEVLARKELIDYIDNLYGRHRLNPMLFKQIKSMREEGYTYQGMKLTLWYFHELKNNPVLEDSGIGIIPYIYEETKRWYIKAKNASDSYEELKEQGVALTEDVFVDYVPKPREDYSERRKIDIEGILD